jgi:hypothetical protein
VVGNELISTAEHSVVVAGIYIAFVAMTWIRHECISSGICTPSPLVTSLHSATVNDRLNQRQLVVLVNAPLHCKLSVRVVMMHTSCSNPAI